MTDKQPITGLSISEIQLFEEPQEGLVNYPGKKKRGRQKTDKYVSYDEASAFIKGELIQSRDKYYEWFDRHKPKDIPKYPYRIYQHEWQGWNSFLGNTNTFGLHNSGKWRPYEEAMMFVHSQGLASYAEWTEYCKSGNLPADIPPRPDLTYTKWRTWNHWLGNKYIEALEAKRQAEGKTQIYYIIHEPGTPENVLTFGIEPAGVSGFREKWEREHFTIIRAFWYDRNEADYINAVVAQLSSTYQGDEKQRIVPNFWEVVYYLEQKLDRVNLKLAYQTTSELRSQKVNGIELL